MSDLAILGNITLFKWKIHMLKLNLHRLKYLRTEVKTFKPKRNMLLSYVNFKPRQSNNFEHDVHT